MRIVYSSQDISDNIGQGTLTGIRIAGSKVSIIQNPGKVAVTNSYFIEGAPHSEPSKRFYRWRTHRSEGFIRTPGGLVRPYSSHRKWDKQARGGWRPSDITLFGALKETGEFSDALRNSMWEEFGVTSINEMYPMLDLYGLPHDYKFVPKNLTMAFRRRDWNTFTAAAFGMSRVTPRLVAAVKNQEPVVVSLAQQFRGLVSDDKIIHFLNNVSPTDEGLKALVDAKNVFRAELVRSEESLVNSLFDIELSNVDIGAMNQMSTFVKNSRTFSPGVKKKFERLRGPLFPAPSSWSGLRLTTV